jgi:asparagine synthase (glutamine-hydrolysing)
MCGIAGIFNSNSVSHQSTLIKKMTDVLAHRGPDGEGAWTSENGCVTFGHRRLSIIDLANHASQPMHYLDRYVITFNGEIYNYIEIRKELLAKGHFFKTQSDTEIILAAYHEWNDECLQHFDGMFAIAIYDKLSNSIFCARDRFGEKPFYYAFDENGALVFASEMKALWAYGIKRNAREDMLFNFLAHDLVENPLDQRDTFFQNIYKLKAAHCFNYVGGTLINQVKYWEINKNESQFFEEKELTNKFLELFHTSIERRMRSDVALGSSLSGGLDSSSIVALVGKFTNTNHTFSARFPGFKKDEGEFIDHIVRKFNTKHHNIIVDEEKLVNELDKLIWHQEEPFQTGSIFAQYCVYEEARKSNITVMLDGQGADEYLGGYEKDFNPYLKELYKRGDKTLFSNFRSQIRENHGFEISFGNKDKFGVISPKLYSGMASLKHLIKPVTFNGINSDFAKGNRMNPFSDFNDLKSTLAYEMQNQGLEKLLKFADRNSMAHSVEVRLPFLYHKLVEFIFSLDSSLLLQHGWSKAILRNAMQHVLPQEIVRRKDKVGFEAPSEQWMSSQKMVETFNESKRYMENNKYLKCDYQSKWKTIVAYKFLKG